MDSKFDSIFSDDPLGLLEIQLNEDKKERTTADKRLIESFE